MNVCYFEMNYERGRYFEMNYERGRYFEMLHIGSDMAQGLYM
jgi:hypothetical protein